jgi:hypothetical protein
MDTTTPAEGDVQQDKAAVEAAMLEQAKLEERTKGILKKEGEAKYTDMARLAARGSKVVQTTTKKERMGNEPERADEVASSQQQVFEKYLAAQLELAERGQMVKAVKSLEASLKEKMRVHQGEPEHPLIWRVAKVLSDLGLKHAVRCLN